MSVIEFRKKNHSPKKDPKSQSYDQKLNDKEKITSHILGFLSKESRKRTLERIKLELGLQEDTSGDRYSSGYHT